MNRIAFISAATVGAVAAGTFLIGTFDGAPSTARTAQTRHVLHLDHVPMSSAAQLSTYANAVVKGRFTGAVGTGMASQYRMGAPGEGDLPVKVWTFKVDRTFKGQVDSEVQIVAYDTDKVTTTDAPAISTDSAAVVFLTEAVNGARVIVAGTQGLLTVAPGGGLKPAAPDVALSDARDETALAAAVN